MLGNIERASGEIQKTYGKYNVSTCIIHEIAIIAYIEVAGLAQVVAVTNSLLMWSVLSVSSLWLCTVTTTHIPY